MSGAPDLPAALADFGAAQLAAVIIAVYLVVGEPFVGYVLHRRFEGRLRTDPAARRSFYRRLLVLEWGLALVALVVWLAAPEVSAAEVGLRWPTGWPGVGTWLAVVVLGLLVLLTTRALRSGAVAGPPPETLRRTRPGEARHAEPPGHSTLALLPRSRSERRLFALVGVTAGMCEEWLYRGFFLAVVAALAPGLPALVLVLVAALAFGVAHAYQGLAGVVTTGVLGGVLAGVYLDTGSLLVPVLLHAAIDLRFLFVPSSALPSAETPERA
ncbi:CPBP family intramembrane glutamic endopeptidase [Modestobacter sp. VKM Ac-2978]|uniref:CPBP family intramembrane glutamic endopeptidase n=1 Tax=Modestobacter sp. VKM Ac-2978 TaxID=3004132 RepID=UPI0022AA24F4|nr:CPBP family intramembrane glutamic endopeptidase [Modestobacter sp. VKM Ac-2978]MCZ2847639.1 CPBP family intramembrane metalloprotease [Modestobacter sp. VKM Ac-2978]